MFKKKDDIQALIRKAERATKKKNRTVKKQLEMTPEQQLKQTVSVILLVSGLITVVLVAINFITIGKYDPSYSTNSDVTRLNDIKNFIYTENTDEYEEVIAKHNDENKNNRLDIKTVYSSTGRDYPFANILNKTQDTITTKLCKFINTELKPAIVSYKLVNGTLPLKEKEEGTYADIVDLDLLKDLINIRDTEITGYSYEIVSVTEENDITISVLKDKVVVPIILFDPTKFKINEINKSEVNLIQGEHSIILKPMEEYNNIRLLSIDISDSKKSCTIVDTLTDKEVKISIS